MKDRRKRQIEERDEKKISRKERIYRYYIMNDRQKRDIE